MKKVPTLLAFVFVCFAIRTIAYILSPAIYGVIERDTAEIIATVSMSGVGLACIFGLLNAVLPLSKSDVKDI